MVTETDAGFNPTPSKVRNAVVYMCIGVGEKNFIRFVVIFDVVARFTSEIFLNVIFLLFENMALTDYGFRSLKPFLWTKNVIQVVTLALSHLSDHSVHGDNWISEKFKIVLYWMYIYTK